MPELYPTQATHSTSPNIPLPDVKWEHPLPHNPYTAHHIYSTSNLLPLTQNISSASTLTSGAQSSTSPSLTSNTLQPITSQNDMNEYKDGNDNNVPHTSSPGAQQSYGNMPPTPTSMVTMLGPNSGKF